MFNADYLQAKYIIFKKQIPENYVSRCIIINVDPEMAVRDPELEPLRTLRS
jgi:hypothetical protein